MQAVNVVLVPENEVSHKWNFDSEQFKRPQSGLVHTITHTAKVANTPLTSRKLRSKTEMA